MQVQVPLYYGSTRFSRVTSIKFVKSNQEVKHACKLKRVDSNMNVGPSTEIFPQNIKCSLPGIGCSIVRYDIQNNVAAYLLRPQ